jgi:hypothetical protein
VTAPDYEPLHEPGACTRCDEVRALLTAIRRSKYRDRYDKPRAKVDFNPLDVRINW